MSATSAAPAVATAMAREIPSSLAAQERRTRERREALLARGARKGHELVSLLTDEWWPVYSPASPTRQPAYEWQHIDVIEVDDELLRRWKAALAEFQVVQAKIVALVDEATE